jgi:hypothetical protein
VQKWESLLLLIKTCTNVSSVIFYFKKPLATNFGKAHSEGLLPYAIKLAVKSPSISPLISSAFAPPNPLFQWYPQSKEISLNMGINAEARHLMHEVRDLIIVVVLVGTVKIRYM